MDISVSSVDILYSSSITGRMSVMHHREIYLKGIHHASAITANGLANFDFYTKVLGLRLVKKTVNQDDTSMYHLFMAMEKETQVLSLLF